MASARPPRFSGYIASYPNADKATSSRILRFYHVLVIHTNFCSALELIKPRKLVPARTYRPCRLALSPVISGTNAVRWEPRDSLLTAAMTKSNI